MTWSYGRDGGKNDTIWGKNVRKVGKICQNEEMIGKRYQWKWHIKVIHKVTLSFTPFSFAFAPYPLFQWYPQRKQILLNLGMKCWNSAFNAQGSRVIIVVVQVGAVKISVAAVEALRKKKRQDEIQFTTKIGGKTHLGANYFLL